MQNKTFRLFISSTFSDFNQERRLLQTYVFPYIKKYCKDLNKGYTFQPIDLRWGVSNEAQLDQKALALCIEEVQASKSQPHPNFLIMIGDRYGWVPTPYAIEKKEFDDILESIEKNNKEIEIEYWEHNKENYPNIYGKGVKGKKTAKNRKTNYLELLRQWYKLDYNQLPASYILQRRTSANQYGNYEIYENWGPEEDALRDILQKTVEHIDIDKLEKEKYFTSATEHETIDGIFKYLQPTQHQLNLEIDNENYSNIDKENVYAYIRNIESIEDEDEDYIENFLDEDYDNKNSRIQKFKERLIGSIKEKNKFIKSANLIELSKDEINASLNYKYKAIENEEESDFVKKIIEYLKKSIDAFNPIEYTEKALEPFEQGRFKHDPLEPFTDAKGLIEGILKEYDRTIQPEQLLYLENIYKEVSSPLYITIAAQEIRHWKSTDMTIDTIPTGKYLANSQQDIIEDFIDNLHSLYHHDEEFVQRVFSYIYLADGLNESELLEIISLDEKLIKKLAPETFHNHHNVKPELPVVIWARLHTQIKEFIKESNIIGYGYSSTVMKLSLPVLLDVIDKAPYLKLNHELMIEDVYQLIYIYHEIRYGELYIDLIVDYNQKYTDNEKIKEYIKKFADISGTTGVVEVYGHDDNLISELQDAQNNINRVLGDRGSNEFHKLVINNVHSKAKKLESLNISKSIEYLKICNEIMLFLYEKKSSEWADLYTKNLHNLSYFLEKNNQVEESIYFINLAIEKLAHLYANSQKAWADKYLDSLGHLEYLYTKNNDDMIDIKKSIINVLESLYNRNNHSYNQKYVDALNQLAYEHYKKEEFFHTISLAEKSVIISEEIYEYDVGIIETYLQSLKKLTAYYGKHSEFIKRDDLLNKQKYLYEVNSMTGTPKYIKLIDTMNGFKDSLDKESLTRKDDINYAIHIYNQLSEQYSNGELKQRGVDYFIYIITNALKILNMHYTPSDIYLNFFNNLSLYYQLKFYEHKRQVDLETSLLVINKSLDIMELMSKDIIIDKFPGQYIIALDRKATLLLFNKEKDTAKKILEYVSPLTKQLVNKNHDEWQNIYNAQLDNLERFYTIPGDLLQILVNYRNRYECNKDEISLVNEILVALNKIVKKLYENNNLDDYIEFYGCCTALAQDIYHNNSSNPNTNIGYVSLMGNLVLSYLKCSVNYHLKAKQITNYLLNIMSNDLELNFHIQSLSQITELINEPYSDLEEELGKYDSCEGRILLNAVKGNKIQIVKQMIKNGVDINYGYARDDGFECYTPLETAVSNFQYDMVELLLKNNAKIEIFDLCRIGTVLVSAIYNSDIKMIKILLEYGADVNQGTAYQYFTPLETAIGVDDIEIVEILLKNNAELKFEFILNTNNEELLELLLDNFMKDKNDVEIFDVFRSVYQSQRDEYPPYEEYIKVGQLLKQEINDEIVSNNLTEVIDIIKKDRDSRILEIDINEDEIPF